MTVSRTLNLSPQRPKHGGIVAPQMFSNLFSDALFTKQRKRIRCCAAASRNASLKSLGNDRRTCVRRSQPAPVAGLGLAVSGRIAGAGGNSARMSAKGKVGSKR
ncbi:hypothetical protein, partial [Mesorhizobium sp. M2E.F.Ca.ET.154.01.1.1]|uniref:hypothetical protein n=1 Tax=Mesorhizobium sp. M2E.F.Ca.ET.154.01.1.1 TaxID=2500521 RepID=UPI001AEDA043